MIKLFKEGSLDMCSSDFYEELDRVTILGREITRYKVKDTITKWINISETNKSFCTFSKNEVFAIEKVFKDNIKLRALFQGYMKLKGYSYWKGNFVFTLDN